MRFGLPIFLLISTVASGADEFARQVDRAVRELAADAPVTRAHAKERLWRLAEEPGSTERLAGEIQRNLARTDLPLEARLELRRLAEQYPAEIAADVRLDEIPRLLDQLNHASYSVRIGAAQRLEFAVRDPRLLGAVWTQVKVSWAPATGDDRLYLALWNQARRQYATADVAQVTLPPVTDEQLADWLRDLSRRPPSPAARRELEDALLRDDLTPRITAALKQRIAGGAAGDELTACEELLERLRPMVVAEIWKSGQIVNVQCLWVGVPQWPPTAVRATHFDRTDGTTIHCASGNSLNPGDYVSGRANPPTHPQPTAGRDGVMFHLNSLTTARRRLAYEYEADSPEGPRLRAITQRTCEAWLRDKHALTEREIALLMQLDGDEVSKFVGTYFNQIDDGAWREEPMLEESAPLDRQRTNFPSDEWMWGLRPTSRHGMVCAVLAKQGTAAALPGLLAAIQAKRYLLGANDTRIALPWLAVLKIAGREKGAEIDTLLAGLIERTDPLYTDRKNGPDVGATAAALLLLRHGSNPEEFGLETQVATPPARVLEEVQIPQDPFRVIERNTAEVDLYRFSKPEHRAEVIRWWKARQSELARRLSVR